MDKEFIFAEGDEVMLSLTDSIYVTKFMRRYNFRSYKVTKVSKYNDANVRGISYELDGVVSHFGIPYNFQRQDLIRITNC